MVLAAQAMREGTAIVLSDDLIHGGVGKSRPKQDSYETALGQRPFIDDMRFDGMVHGALKFSEHPRAKVLSINADKAAGLDGVIRIFTAVDIPGDRMTGVIYQDWPLMVAEGEITRYQGDVLAGVVAIDEATARKACELIEVDYQVLEAVTDVDIALTDHIKVHEKGNLLATTEFSRGGDVAEALKVSAHSVSGRYRTQLTEHAYLEPECCIARPQGEDALQIYTQSQGI